MEIINIEGRTFRAMMERFEAFAKEVESVCGNKGERRLSKWLDTQEVCVILDISKRTLQKLRDNGTLPFTRIENKMYYRPSDVEKLIGPRVNKK
ncbi:MAG: helix-turn-helix domain-containing protein [Rikenellaceae bacterium]|nr:helix-turn-helix domain-containing protein [Rikenellaceae bacterium]